MDESDSDSSQVYRPNIRRGVINYDEEHSIRVSPPTSGPTLEASTSHKIPSEESDNHVPDEERVHRPEEEREVEGVNIAEEEECDSDTEALPSSLSNRTPPAKKRKQMASSSTAFMPEEKKTREKLSWSVVANFDTKGDYEKSEIFNKLK